MGRILEYNSLGAAPADDDLLFLGDYSADNANPATKRLLISDLNKKRNIDAADSNGLKLRDDAQNIGVFIKDGGVSGPVFVGVNNEDPSYNLDLKATNANVTFRIEAGTSNDAIIRLDQTGTQRASIGYDDTNDLLKLNNSSNFDSNNHLIINTNGNIGVGVVDPDHPLEVNGIIKAASGDSGVILNAAKREIKGIFINTGTGGESDNVLHLNRHSGGKIYFMRYTDSGEGTSNPVMWLDNVNRTVNIGNVAEGVSNQAKLSIVESGITTPVIHAENYYNGSNGTNVASIKIIRTDQGDSTDFYLNVGNDGIFNVGTSIANASANSVNISESADLSIGTTSSSYKLNVANTANIISSFLMSENATSSNNTGARILVESAALHTDASSVIAFPFTSGSRTTGWMCGNLRNSSTNYFGIYYSLGDPGTPSNVEFNSTLNQNQVYITQAGDLNVKQDVKATRNVQGAAFYDIGGTTAGNYCRGRFIQVFISNLHLYDSGTNNAFVGALNFGQVGGTNVESIIAGSKRTTDDLAGTKKSGTVSSIAPFDGKLLRVQLLPSCTWGDAGYFAFYSSSNIIDLTSSDPSHTSMCYKQFATTYFVEETPRELINVWDGQGAADANEWDSDTNDMINFNKGDYLTFMIDPSGQAVTANHANLQIISTIEFHVGDI